MFTEFNSPENYLNSRKNPGLSDPDLSRCVARIIRDVYENRDGALKRLTRQFDGINLGAIRVPLGKIQQCVDSLTPVIRDILVSAIRNVRAFHRRQLQKSWVTCAEDGSKFGMQFTPIERVGCYIPGGTAGYPSTVIMTIVPAQIAGVPKIILVSPPVKNGQVNSLVLAATGLLGIDEVYAVGGAQAIAGLTVGTQSIPKVDKIVGPGNAYVNEAKRQVFGTVGIDSLAGPTEVVILADESANPEYVVRDLFAQAEHDRDSRAILISESEKLLAQVQALASKQINSVKRGDILKAAIKDHGALVRIENISRGLEFINKLAPEHVQILTDDADDLLPAIKNAGAICIGPTTPVAVGDYFAGPNHVLPTAGTARFSSPLSVHDFMKFSSVLKFSKKRLTENQAKIAAFAELEELPNHRESLLCRK